MKNNEKINYHQFSVSICVYGKDNAEWFDTALNSIINQTVRPAEIVLVVDGIVPDSIQNVIDKYRDITNDLKLQFNVIHLEKNFGHGIARFISVWKCKFDYVAIMDADDISLPDRFETELKVMMDNGADVVGGDIEEFIGNETNVVGYRVLPRDDFSIKKYMRKRCPFNQVTVLFNKAAYEKAGGYLDWFCEEDYYLWLRMALHGAIFANTGSVLVHVRIGKEMYQRRGGIKYFMSEARLQKLMLDKHVINFPRYAINVVERLILQVLLPNKIRGWLFQKLARNQKMAKN